MDVHPYKPHKAHDEILVHHKSTWHGITRVAIFGTAAIVVILVLMATFLVHRTVG
jgi:hypothetical protein